MSRFDLVGKADMIAKCQQEDKLCGICATAAKQIAAVILSGEAAVVKPQPPVKVWRFRDTLFATEDAAKAARLAEIELLGSEWAVIPVEVQS